MTVILLIVIVVLLVLLLARRGGAGSRDRRFEDVRPAQYDPPSTGFGAGSFLGGMAAGALLTYLLDQGRIDMGQYNYFNSLDEQQMMDELMQQNIIQQNEIDDLQRRLDNSDVGYHDNDHPEGNYDGFRDEPYSNVNDHDDNYSDNDGDGGWV